MIRIGSIALTLIVLSLLASTPALAQQLDRTRVMQCSFSLETDSLFVNWLDVENAEKYSLAFVCLHAEIIGNICRNEREEFEFGTSDRQDGQPFNLSEIELTLEELEALANVSSGGLSGYECYVRVKALAPHTEWQNGEWSQRRSCGTLP